jgi:hypothetical protein
MGLRHLLLGSKHPLYQKLHQASNFGTFAVVRMLLDSVTFFLNEKEDFLVELALKPKLSDSV